VRPLEKGSALFCAEAMYIGEMERLQAARQEEVLPRELL